ncbi:MAG: hypothetical protein ABW252_20640 [Polyangiales bacterium]
MLVVACGGGSGEYEVRTNALDAGAADAATAAPAGSASTRDGGLRGPTHLASADASVPGIDEPGGGRGAPDDVLVDTLPPADDRALCEKMSAAVVELAPRAQGAACVGAALRAAEERTGTCNQARDACMAQQREEASFDAFDCDEPPHEGGCPGLTVRHMEACIASYRERAAQLASFTCRSDADEVEEAVAAVDAISPACQIVIDKCGS